MNTDCLRRARRFLFLRDLRSTLDFSSVPAAAVLRMLYANLRPEDRPDFYAEFLPAERYPELYGSGLGLEPDEGKGDLRPLS